MQPSSLLVVLLSLLLTTTPFIAALQFNVPPSQEVCVSELVPRNELLRGDYTVLQPPGTRVSVNVFNPSQENIYTRGSDESGSFSATASTGGEYKVCIANNDGMNVDKQLSLNLRSGLETKDYANIAKSSNLKPMEVELKRLEDLVNNVHQELQFLEGREKVQRSVNDSNGSRVIAFSTVSLIILVALSVVQVTHLKGFFKRKHLID